MVIRCIDISDSGVPGIGNMVFPIHSGCDGFDSHGWHFRLIFAGLIVRNCQSAVSWNNWYQSGDKLLQ